MSILECLGIINIVDNFVRNQVIKNGHNHSTTLDSYWIVNKDLKIEKSENNKKVYDKIVRQLEILKYLCEIGDFYCADKENVRTIDKLYQDN